MAPHHHYLSPRQFLSERYTFCGASFQDLPAIVSLLNQRHICSAAFCVDDLQTEWRLERYFATLPVERARELCETLGWRQITPPPTEMKRVTGALRLPENANRAVNVFEKAVEQLN